MCATSTHPSLIAGYNMSWRWEQSKPFLWTRVLVIPFVHVLFWEIIGRPWKLKMSLRSVNSSRLPLLLGRFRKEITKHHALTLVFRYNHHQTLYFLNLFQVSEKRWYWLKVFALATIRDWDALEKFSKEKRPPIGKIFLVKWKLVPLLLACWSTFILFLRLGYRPFVEACVDAGEKGEALKYIPKLADLRERAEVH